MVFLVILNRSSKVVFFSRRDRIDALGPATLGSLLMAALVWLAKLAPTAPLGRVAELILMGATLCGALVWNLHRDRARSVFEALRKADA